MPRHDLPEVPFHLFYAYFHRFVPYDTRSLAVRLAFKGLQNSGGTSNK